MQWLVDIINSPNANSLILVAIFVLFLVLLLAKRGLLGIHTKWVSLGTSMREEAIKSQQMTTAYLFIMSLEGKIDTDTSTYNGYKTKYILERVYDEVVEWIIHNHITDDEVYVQAKAEKLRSLVYSLDVIDDFKTKEFADRMDKWTKELIDRLLRIRKVYHIMYVKE